jgi:hypothetical protein
MKILSSERICMETQIDKRESLWFKHEELRAWRHELYRLVVERLRLHFAEPRPGRMSLRELSRRINVDQSLLVKIAKKENLK